MKNISIIIPVYNESSNIRPMVEALHQVMAKTGYGYRVIFVDDGSTDQTLETIQQLAQCDTRVFYISFSRNFGHQNALKAGIDFAGGDAMISLDGDLQHPPELIPVLLEKWEQGYDIVYTRRRDEKGRDKFKRNTSNWFYRLMRRLSGLQMEPGIADFRLLSRRVADILGTFREQDLFLRGILKWMGFRQYAVDYTPGRRFSGQTKYSSRKMAKLALQGITSFSVKPLYISIILGIGFSALSLAYVPYIVWCVISGHAVAGWASTIMVIMFFGGMQMILLGIIGIYVGKIFIQSKQRPGYIIKETNMPEHVDNN
ncbi:MAG: glycosyltransferase family 2 protein [Bacteroidales bacterium]|nr:glycosyltransferase family 2 protein [Bacteroidales bacterium]